MQANRKGGVGFEAKTDMCFQGRASSVMSSSGSFCRSANAGDARSILVAMALFKTGDFGT
jgi:hypothetical protein